MRARVLITLGVMGTLALAPAANAETGITCWPSHRYEITAGHYVVHCSNPYMEDASHDMKVTTDVPWLHPSITGTTLPAHRQILTFGVDVHKPRATQGQVIITFPADNGYTGGVAITFDTRPEPIPPVPPPSSIPLFPIVGGCVLAALLLAWAVKRRKPARPTSYGFGG